MERKRIEEYINAYIDSDILQGPIEEVSSNILKIKENLIKDNRRVKENPDAFIDFKLDYTVDEDGYLFLQIYGIRMETDVEMEQRILNEERIRSRREENRKRAEQAEFEQYLKLKKKYEQ